MPITPDLPFPKSTGDAIRSKDWNDLVVETQRLDNAKVDRSGDAISGNLSVSGSLGVKTASPQAPLHVVGVALVSDGDGYAVPQNDMQAGSLTIGSIAKSFGGGNNWNTNTAGLLMETAADTEIAVHDSGTRLASIVRYESASNSLTIGRDMGWGAIAKVVINGHLGIGVDDPGHNIDVADRIRIRQGSSGTAGMWLYQNGPAEDRAFVGMNNDNILGLYGNKGGDWSLNMDVSNGNVGIRTTPVSNRSVYVNSASRSYGIVVTQADSYAIYAIGNTYASGRAKDNKIRSTVSRSNRVTTTSTAWVDVPNMSLTINLPIAGTVLILAQINGVQAYGQANIRGSFRILVDGAQVQLSRDEFNNDGWEIRGIHMSEIRGLSTGSHTIKLQWATTAGTLACSYHSNERLIHVIELS